MTQPELYEALWEHFIVFERGLDPDRQVALDSCIEAASRKLAARMETAEAAKTHVYSHLKIHWNPNDSDRP